MAVKKRLVINFTGYEGLHPDAVRGRYLNSAADFNSLWHAKTKAGPMLPEGPNIASMHLETSGSDWAVETEFCQYGTADLFDVYSSRNVVTRFATGMMAFLDILLTGTFWRYLRTSWRFCIFFMWPFVLACFISLVGLGIGLGPLWGGFSAYHLLWTVPLALAVARLLIRWPGQKVFLSYLLDDWAAASDRIYRRNAALLERRAAFAAHLARKLRESDADEVLIIGHSLGTVPAVEAIADVWRSEPQLMKRRPISLMATGSCLLMIAFHPRAAQLREDVRVVLQETPVLWTEFQTIADIVHFYKSESGNGSWHCSAQRSHYPTHSLQTYSQCQALRPGAEELLQDAPIVSEGRANPQPLRYGYVCAGAICVPRPCAERKPGASG
nr:alpha/beta hydrolase [Phyllobacterium sp. 628]